MPLFQSIKHKLEDKLAKPSPEKNSEPPYAHNFAQIPAPVPTQLYVSPPFPQQQNHSQALPVGWQTLFDQNSQRWYYLEIATGRTQWEPPTQPYTINTDGPVYSSHGQIPPSAAPQAPASNSLMPSLTTDTRGLLCNRCNAALSGQLWHCNECDGGDFDICANCRQQGVGCYSASHHLISMDTALWQNVVYVTYAGMVRPDGRKVADESFICDICDRDAPDALNCKVCRGGDYDICRDCWYFKRATCLDKSHTLFGYETFDGNAVKPIGTSSEAPAKGSKMKAALGGLVAFAEGASGKRKKGRHGHGRHGSHGHGGFLEEGGETDGSSSSSDESDDED